MISFIVPTIGRPSLLATLKSIELYPGDEIIVIGNVKESVNGQTRYVYSMSGGDWGHTERNIATPMARGQYIAHIDDDDTYVPGSRKLMSHAINRADGKPVMFKMRYPNGITLWRDPKIYCGNVGTPMFLMPNRPTMLGRWEPYIGGDCAFLESSKWASDDYVWRSEVIAMIGHNAGE